jgi:thiol-disulfide isomerase/thioredoxin
VRFPRTTSVARLILVLGAAVLVVAGCSDSDGTSVTEVPFTASDGSSASVADFAGQPLVLNMWATNCVPCVKEMPALDEVAAEQSGALQIIGVNVFDTPQDATAFATDLGVSYPQFTDPDGELSSALSVTGLPATAFFDAAGKLIDVHQGAYTADELRAAIAQQFPNLGPEGTTP